MNQKTSHNSEAPSPINGGRTLQGRDKIKLLFVRSPRHVWPIVNENDNFLVQLAYPTLAAYLRKYISGIEITILDCPPRRMGWKSLENFMAELKPDVVAIGEKTVFYHEGFRAFELAKRLDPQVVCIAGGVMYSATPEWTLDNCAAIDYVGLYEGEETLKELIETLREGGDVNNVRGIAFRDTNGKVHFTPPRPLIRDLDSLPMPAYDLAGLDYYQPFGKLWPRAITVQRSRGCKASCNFCSWRIQEGEPFRKNGSNGAYSTKQAYRTKSVERMVEEVEWLYRKFDVRYLFWVDATFNYDSQWLGAFHEELLRRDIKVGYWAFLRADQLLQQEEDGVLELMVRGGLRHTLVGAEHDSQKALDFMRKGIADADVTRRAFNMLADKYPEVFRQATYVTGLPDDNEESIKALLKHAHECNLDFAAFHPAMPYPGTELMDYAREHGLIEELDYSKYDMFVPVMRTHHISRDKVAEATQYCYKNFVSKKPFQYFGRMFSDHKIRRDLHRWFVYAIGRVILTDLKNSFTKKEHKFKGFSGIDTLWKPEWYDD